MGSNLDPRYKFAYFFAQEKIEMNLLLAIASIIISLGFFFGGKVENNSNYTFVYTMFNDFIWAFMFMLYGSVKLLTTFQQGYNALKCSNSMLGIWMWCYIFLSFAIYDTTAVAPTEWLLLMPAITEVIVLVSLFHVAGVKNDKS
jgi:hypothetical protein